MQQVMESELDTELGVRKKYSGCRILEAKITQTTETDTEKDCMKPSFGAVDVKVPRDRERRIRAARSSASYSRNAHGHWRRNLGLYACG